MKIILIITFLFISSVQAQYNCQLRLSVRNINFSWDGTSQVVTQSVRLRRNDTSFLCQTFRVGFSKGSAGTYDRKMFNGSNYVSYNVYQNSSTNNPLKELADITTSTDYIPFTFSGNQRTITHTFEARYDMPNDGRELIAAARYTDIITASATNPFYSTQTATNNFRNRVTIPAIIDISIVDSGPFNPSATSYTMDFANLTQGEVKSVNIKVRSNAGYTLQVSSVNGGSLKHTGANYTVPYSLTVNGSSTSFPGPGADLTLGTASGVTPSDGVNFALDFEIGDPSQKLAGTYNDVITVTAMSID